MALVTPAVVGCLVGGLECPKTSSILALCFFVFQFAASFGQAHPNLMRVADYLAAATVLGMLVTSVMAVHTLYAAVNAL